MPDNHYSSTYSSWEFSKDFVSPTLDTAKGGICVRVSILKLSIPRFSYVIGWKLPNGELKIHFQADQDVDQSQLPELISLAKIHIKTEMDAAEKIRVKQEAEYRVQAEADQLRKTAKKKQYEANQERRRVENRARAGGGGGGKKRG
jgi:hypothetical protein